jgi:ferrochelatase
MKAVVLFNLGGPDSLASVEPFLFNLFSDPDIIRLPRPLRFLQRTIASGISRRRGPESRHNYERIGGKSPLLENTKKQAAALEKALGAGYQVFIAMRYWEPLAPETVAALKAANPEAVYLLPLYPQYSISTTASSLNDFDAAAKAAGVAFNTKRINEWYDRPGYAEIIASCIRPALAGRDPATTHLLFSAHGVPVSYVTKYGDPYQKQVEAHVADVVKALGTALPHSLCYQSRVGPVKWIGPDIEAELVRLSKLTKTLVVYPVSFVSEHVETLFELDLMYAERARELGLEFVRAHTPGEDPAFIAFLAGLVRDMERA